MCDNLRANVHGISHMIVLFGATGVTGKLVARELMNLNVPVRLAGRDEKALKSVAGKSGFQIKTFDLQEPESIKAALDGASVAINCVGPFTKYGLPIAKAVVKAGVHYLDTTGEQAFISQIFEELGERARKEKICLVPACAFEYAISDTLAGFAELANPHVDSIEVVYRVKGAATSVGTRRSFLKQMEYPWFRLSSGQLKEINFIPFCRDNLSSREAPRMLIEFPGGEAVLFPLHLRVRSVRSFMQLPRKFPKVTFSFPTALVRAAFLFPLSGALMATAATKEGAPSDEELNKTSASVTCTARGLKGSAVCSANAHNPYLVTAVIISQIATKLLKGGAGISGPCSPSMVEGPEFIREVTKNRGVEWIL
jgi:short subunit dehydrogenase-like uncharacterized protein